MRLYERSPYYMISHITLGFLSAWYSWLLVFVLSYQALQLFFNVRVFPLEGTIKSGNNLAHTSLKVIEILLGYGCGLLVKSYS